MKILKYMLNLLMFVTVAHSTSAMETKTATYDAHRNKTTHQPKSPYHKKRIPLVIRPDGTAVGDTGPQGRTQRAHKIKKKKALSVLSENKETKSIDFYASLNGQLKQFIIKGGYFQLRADHKKYAAERDEKGESKNVYRAITLLFITAERTTEIGYIRYTIYPGETTHIGSLRVEPDYRKNYGLGTLLILEALKDAQITNLGCEKAFADTTVMETLTPGGKPVSWYLFAHKFYFLFKGRTFVFTEELSNILRNRSAGILKTIFTKLEKAVTNTTPAE